MRILQLIFCGIFLQMLQPIFSLAKKSKTRSDKHTSFVGFTAWAQSIIEYGFLDSIVFSGALLNEGNFYSTRTGEFNCPVNGTYLVSVSLVRNGEDELNIWVYKGQEILFSAIHFSSGDPDTMVTHTVLTQCQAGEGIGLIGAGEGALNGNPVVPRSTFTVMSIAEGFDEAVSTTRRHLSNVTGFTAVKNSTQNYLGNDVIIYDYTDYNAGGYYDTELNRFVCPRSGLYFASITSTKDSTNPLRLAITKNTMPLLDSLDDSQGNTDITANNNALLVCDENEVITVRAAAIGGISGSTDTRTSFSMFLINEIATGVRHNASDLIAFSMYKKGIQAYGVNTVITFDGVLYNDGEYYDVDNNRFITPVDGIYYITLNVKKTGTYPLSIYLSQNSNTLFTIENRFEENSDNVFSNSVLINAVQGDLVEVKGYDTGSVFGEYNAAHTTYSIFLLLQL